jgi:hypothetical protein
MPAVNASDSPEQISLIETKIEQLPEYHLSSNRKCQLGEDSGVDPNLRLAKCIEKILVLLLDGMGNCDPCLRLSLALGPDGCWRVRFPVSLRGYACFRWYRGVKFSFARFHGGDIGTVLLLSISGVLGGPAVIETHVLGRAVQDGCKLADTRPSRKQFDRNLTVVWVETPVQACRLHVPK